MKIHQIDSSQFNNTNEKKKTNTKMNPMYSNIKGSNQLYREDTSEQNQPKT